MLFLSMVQAASIFVMDDDLMGHSKENSQLIIEFPNYLSVDQLLESVSCSSVNHWIITKSGHHMTLE